LNISKGGQSSFAAVVQMTRWVIRYMLREVRMALDVRYASKSDPDFRGAANAAMGQSTKSLRDSPLKREA
jgi:hypothetical protein